jgi:hemolysin D
MSKPQAARDKPAKPPSMDDLAFLPDSDAIEQRPLGGLTRAVLGVLSVMLATGIVWASVSEIDEIVTAPGKLVSTVPNLTVQPLETAIVQSIDVRLGQVVRRGERLASLDATFAGADQAQLQALVEQLDVRSARIAKELSVLGSNATLEALAASMGRTAMGESQASPLGAAGPKGGSLRLQHELHDARLANYAARLRAQQEQRARLEATLKTNRDDQQLTEQRLKSLIEVEQMQERLVSQQFGAKRQLLEARERRQAVERDLELAANRAQEILKEMASLDAEHRAFRNEWRQRLLEEQAELFKERGNLAAQLDKADRRKSLIELTAPADGIVLEIPQRSLGSVVPSAEVMFTLVPLGGELEAELKIAARDVGFVKPGDQVKVKLDAFPFQKYGTLKGSIGTVSDDAFKAEASVARAGSFYIARVKLQSLELERRSDEVLIRPGSSLSGEIRVGRRTVMSYFVYPLVGTLDESLRERR